MLKETKKSCPGLKNHIENHFLDCYPDLPLLSLLAPCDGNEFTPFLHIQMSFTRTHFKGLSKIMPYIRHWDQLFFSNLTGQLSIDSHISFCLDIWREKIHLLGHWDCNYGKKKSEQLLLLLINPLKIHPVCWNFYWSYFLVLLSITEKIDVLLQIV